MQLPLDVSCMLCCLCQLSLGKSARLATECQASVMDDQPQISLVTAVLIHCSLACQLLALLDHLQEGNVEGCQC